MVSKEPVKVMTRATIRLSLTFIILDGSSLLFYGLFAHKLKAYLEDGEKMHLQNKIIGSLLIFAGIMLTLVKRN